MSSTEPSAAPAQFPRAMALLVAGAFFMEILDATIITPRDSLDRRVIRHRPRRRQRRHIGLSRHGGRPHSGQRWMADRFGPGPVFAAAIAIFTLASVGCAASVSIPMLVAVRVLQGVGGAMMVPVGRPGGLEIQRYGWTFLVLGVLMLVTVGETLRLPRDAGAAVTATR